MIFMFIISLINVIANLFVFFPEKKTVLYLGRLKREGTVPEDFNFVKRNLPKKRIVNKERNNNKNNFLTVHYV